MNKHLSEQLLRGRNVIVQGITGEQGSFHTKAMLGAGTRIVAGTSPSKAGQTIEGVPVYASIQAIQKDFTVDTSVIFVPAPFAKAAILEAIDAQVPLIICITEGVPVHDVLAIQVRLQRSSSVLIGPNCPGVLLPGVHRLGIIPQTITLPGTQLGSVGVVGRSGTLTYEAVAGLSARGIGQKYIIGIGGDPIRGTGFIDCLALFENDPEVTSIMLIGEVGGTDEADAAAYIQKHVTKPVYGYVAGHHAPPGVQMGHAGAILGSADESAKAKTAALAAAGVITANTITELVRLVRVS